MKILVDQLSFQHITTEVTIPRHLASPSRVVMFGGFRKKLKASFFYGKKQRICLVVPSFFFKTKINQT